MCIFFFICCRLKNYLSTPKQLKLFQAKVKFTGIDDFGLQYLLYPFNNLTITVDDQHLAIVKLNLNG